MTTTVHTDITPGAPANAGVINAPLGQLDASLAQRATNVKDVTYGARGDGVTDDSVAIQAAETALNAAGGGTELFPSGVYPGANVTFYAKIKREGAGIENTIIKLKNTAGAVSLFIAANFATLASQNGGGGAGTSQAGEYNFTFRDMTLDGNKANNATALDVLTIWGYGYELQNVRVRNGNRDGIYSEYSTTGGLPPTPADFVESLWANVKVHDNVRHGVNFNGPHDTVWMGGMSYLNGGRGIWQQAKGTMICVGVHGWGLGQTYAWYLEGVQAICSACVAEGAATAQVFIGASDITWKGVVFAATGATTGFVIGDGTHTNIGGTQLDAKILNCTTAPISFAQDAGGVFRLGVWGTSGPAFTGTYSPASTVEINYQGQANLSVFQFPGPITLRGNAGQDDLLIVDSGAIAGLRLQGSGGQKWIRNSGTTLQVINSANSLAIWTLSDGGDMSVVGGALISSKDRRLSRQSPAFVASFTPDPTLGEIISLGALTANLTVNAVAAPGGGQVLTFIFLQDGSGGRTIAWNAAYKTSWQPAPAANAVSSITFEYDGTNWQQQGGQVPVDTAGNAAIQGTLATAKDRTISKQAPAFNAAPAPDPTAGEIYAMAALTGAVNVANPTNAKQGQRLLFIWTQDGTGGRAVAYTGTNWRSVGIAAQVTTLSTVTIDEAVCVDGTIWRVNRLVTGQTV